MTDKDRAIASKLWELIVRSEYGIRDELTTSPRPVIDLLWQYVDEGVDDKFRRDYHWFIECLEEIL